MRRKNSTRCAGIPRRYVTLFSEEGWPSSPERSAGRHRVTSRSDGRTPFALHRVNDRDATKRASSDTSAATQTGNDCFGKVSSFVASLFWNCYQPGFNGERSNICTLVASVSSIKSEQPTTAYRMNPASAQTLRQLLRTQEVAALGTLHEGRPYVSMVPFATLSGGTGFVVHVSQLAAHTKDMLRSPPVSLLVVAPPVPDVLP